MQGNYPTEYDPTTGLVMQLLPLIIIQVFYAWLVFVLCKKQGWNSWLWTIVTLIPFIGLFVIIVVWFTTIFKTLDRLNVLEGKAPR